MPSTVTDRLQGLTASVAVKAPCYVASTGNITLTSTATSTAIDGVDIPSSARVLFKDQTNSTDNGIYILSANSTWSRTKDFDGTRDAVPGTLVIVDRGTAYGKSLWVANSSSTSFNIAIGSTPITFSRAGFAGLGNILFGELTPTANRVPYFATTSSMALTTLTTFARDFLASSDATDGSSLLNLTIGTDVQAYSANLLALSEAIPAANDIPLFTSTASSTTVDFLDEDNMASDSTRAVASQQSVKKYVDDRTLSAGTDNALVKQDGTAGDLQNTGITVTDDNNLGGHGAIIVINTSAYTFASTDIGRLITTDSTAAVNFILPGSTGAKRIPLGGQFTIAQRGAGQITVVTTSTADTIESKSSNVKLTGRHSIATVVKLLESTTTSSSTGNTWGLYGDLST